MHLQRQAADLKEKADLTLTEKRPKLERVLGSHDFHRLLEFGNLSKMHYTVRHVAVHGNCATCLIWRLAPLA